MTDPYFNTDICVERLYKTYLQNPKLIIAVDFDDTVFNFHNVENQEHTQVINLLKQCQALGFYIVLFTASKKERHDFMKNYLTNLGIRVDSMNENPIDLQYGHEGKIFYNILLDDRSGLKQAYDILSLTINKITHQ